MNSEFAEQAPEVVEYLEHYETSNALTQSALQYMKETQAGAEETAYWWMRCMKTYGQSGDLKRSPRK